jgi:cold-inducible RNA-binding protein
MAKRLYVGNLPFSANQDEVRAEFSKFGNVEDCKLITDRETGKPRGFGFVTFTNPQEADAAIAAMHGSNWGGRSLTVNEAEERRAGGGGGGGGFNRPSGGGGGGGRNFQGGGGRGGGGHGGGGGGRDRGRRRDNDRGYED